MKSKEYSMVKRSLRPKLPKQSVIFNKNLFSGNEDLKIDEMILGDDSPEYDKMKQSMKQSGRGGYDMRSLSKLDDELVNYSIPRPKKGNDFNHNARKILSQINKK